MENCNPAVVPTSGTKPLGPDPHGKAVGMMMYLASNSRPEINFTVDQWARFTNGTKHLHEKTILQICKYLKGTRSDGLIIKPNMKEIFQVKYFANSDFAGLFSVEDPQDVISVRSRTGYVLTFAGYPILWVSKLQTKVKDKDKELKFVSKSTVYEDNTGTISVASCSKLTPT
eukprot:983737-Ditylum_brightwellii.AAC.1